MESFTLDNLKKIFDRCIEIAPRPAHLTSESTSNSNTSTLDSTKTERRRRNRKRMKEKKFDLCHDDPARVGYLSKTDEKHWLRLRSQFDEMLKLKEKLRTTLTDDNFRIFLV